jgi:hypothetical protein
MLQAGTCNLSTVINLMKYESRVMNAFENWEFWSAGHNAPQLMTENEIEVLNGD